MHPNLLEVHDEFEQPRHGDIGIHTISLNAFSTAERINQLEGHKDSSILSGYESGVIPVFRGSSIVRTKQMTEMRPGGRKGLLDVDLSAGWATQSLTVSFLANAVCGPGFPATNNCVSFQTPMPFHQ